MFTRWSFFAPNWIVAFVLFFGLQAPVWAKVEISEDACDRLYAAIEVHDTVYPGARLPAKISLDYGRSTLEDFYRLSETLWRDGFDAKKLRAVFPKLMNGGKLNAEDAEYYKAVRAKFKQLRFAFAAFDENHEYPKRLDKLTAAMGHFSDAIKNDDQDAAKGFKTEILRMLQPKNLGKIDEELAAFSPSGRKSFAAYVKDELKELREMATHERVTPKEFHEMRKIISRQVAIFDTIQTVSPSAQNAQVVKYLSSLNGRMGSMHDKLIHASFADELDYHYDQIDVPADLRRSLLKLVDRY